MMLAGSGLTSVRAVLLASAVPSASWNGGTGATQYWRIVGPSVQVHGDGAGREGQRVAEVGRLGRTERGPVRTPRRPVGVVDVAVGRGRRGHVRVGGRRGAGHAGAAGRGGGEGDGLARVAAAGDLGARGRGGAGRRRERELHRGGRRGVRGDAEGSVDEP